MDEKMTIRFTLAEKWQDKWFRQLSAAEKLLFLYICDNCNLAGIWEIDIEQAAFSIGFDLGAMQGAFKGLARGYEQLNETHIWVKNFLKHQRNLPLNPNNAAHASIINLLLPYKSLSENILQLLSTEQIKGLTRGLQSPLSISISKGISKSNSKGKKKFKPPTLKEVELYLKDNPELTGVTARDFWKGYDDGNWEDTRGNPVRNWKLKLRTRCNYGHPSEVSIADKRCAHCREPAVWQGPDDTGQKYYLCEAHKPKGE